MPPAALCAIAPAGTSIRNAIAIAKMPIASLPGVEGSCRPRRIHSQANAGASRITKIGCTDWNHDEGNENPNSSVRV
jgi:hypothetical protein